MSRNVAIVIEHPTHYNQVGSIFVRTDAPSIYVCPPISPNIHCYGEAPCHEMMEVKEYKIQKIRHFFAIVVETEEEANQIMRAF